MQFTVVERLNKETEELIAVAEPSFLQEKLSYVAEHQQEYIYVESPQFEALKMDAVVLEFDEAFEVPMALFGLRYQKKVSANLKQFLKDNLEKGLVSGAMFSGNEGIWEINISLNAMKNYDEAQTIEQTLEKLVAFVAEMVQAIEAK
ncbi:hypothetical protein [Caryophanon tenue]|nr:hypothetical protein [Caryophanon tenue]